MKLTHSDETYLIELSKDELKVLFDALEHCANEHCDQPLYMYRNIKTKLYTYHEPQQCILMHLYDTLYDDLER